MILKQQVTLKWRWRIDVDAGLMFILNIDTRSQYQRKAESFQGERRIQVAANKQGEWQPETSQCKSPGKLVPQRVLCHHNTSRFLLEFQ